MSAIFSTRELAKSLNGFHHTSIGMDIIIATEVEHFLLPVGKVSKSAVHISFSYFITAKPLASFLCKLK